MQLESASNYSSSSPAKQRDLRTMATGSRLRKKHKRLDAICEIVYNQNHNESRENTNNNNNNDNSNKGGGSGSRAHLVSDSELRRSSRVRRPPVVLDVSPSPVKKRRRIDKNVSLSADRGIKISSRTRSVKEEEEEEEEDRESGGDLDSSPGNHRRYLLRSRGRNVGIRERRVAGGRRKLFDEIDLVGGELKKEKEELDGGVFTVASKGLERVEATIDFSTGEEEGGLHAAEEVIGMDDRMESAGENDSGKGKIDAKNEAVESMTVPVSEMAGRTEGELADCNDAQPRSDEEEGKERSDGLETEKKSDGNDDVGHLEHMENKMEELEKDRDTDRNTIQADGTLTAAEDGGFHDETGSGLMEVDEMPGESKEVVEPSKLKLDSIDTRSRPRIKQGRRCGLCGCGNDGKPPKRLVQDAGESENDAYSGSSASEEPNYDIWDGFGDEPGWLGRLLGPINDRYGIAGIWVHQHCAVWSPEVYFAGLGCLKNVRAALCRGRALKCSRCGRPGATIGCRVDRCPKTYHLPCARISGCIFDHRKFLIACTDHRHFFQPHGSQYLMRIKKLKAKKMKLELRKMSNDAWRKDVEAEEKWLENCGEDEEFLKRESKRLHRDLLRIAPVYIGGAGLENSKSFEGWESVAGLQDVIQCMKEVVILPLLYPEFFGNLGITPPRGVLLHGYPGTGKTHVVRALIGSCARGDRRIAYFARKGADCLGKYVGDAERQLRLLFQVAERCQPSIIFFDEIDGLAPCRTRQQDQTHSSVVSTLLALMDGLKSRGSVIVIGATNRPEAVDPALRRPGRFDREIYFPLPSVEDRAAILSLHTQRWPKPVSGPLLNWIARRTVGFAGADLQSLCTQAAIIALKRNFPLQEVLSAAGERTSTAERIPLPPFSVEERDWLEALACAPPPCSRREAGIAAHDLVSSPLPTHLIPCFLRPLSSLLISLYIEDGLWMPPPLLRAAEIVKSAILSSLKNKNLPSNHWWSYVSSFLEENDVAKEIQKKLSFAGILIGEASCAGADAISDGINDDLVESDPLVVHTVSFCSNLSRSISFASRRKAELRVLISGDPRSGQRHLASCILNCFVGNVEIQKVDLATISQEAHGDMVQGITQMLLKCASLQSCMIFMPRIDLWALETCDQVNEEGEVSSADHQISDGKESSSTHGEVIEGLKESSSDQCNAAEIPEPQGAAQSASHAWGSFVEQMESISVSTSFIILATSERPYSDLPYKIRQFFESQTSKRSCSTPLQHKSPRFHVHVDRNFNHDEVISLSAAKLSRDLIQLYVQLTYQRAHRRKNPSNKHKICDPVQGCGGSKFYDGNHGPIGEDQHGPQIPCNSLETSLPMNSGFSKGKSSLLLAISTFGYQILRYPHFAELCWVTSKLKEGPYADVSGPWKGWPFNSCIFHPGNSSDEVAVANSSNGKSKDRSGLVRGLTAVGLLAYRGVYKSLREVSFAVRKVLELLVVRVNGKIQSGKDRYQYVRLLSQVAYLEDVVNSWVYALRSLELDAQPKMANPKLNSVEYPNDYSRLITFVQSEGCSQKMFNGNSHAAEQLEGSCPGKLKGFDLSGGDGAFQEGENNLGDPDHEGRAAHSDDGYVPKIVLCDHNKDEHCQSSMVDNQAAINMKNEQIGNTLGPCDPEPTTGSNSGSLQNSNGCRFTEPVVPFENGLCNSSESAASKFSGLGKFHCKVNGLEGRTEPEGAAPELSSSMEYTNSSPGKLKNLSADSGITCFYGCCSRCLHALQDVVLKILICEWQKNKNSWTAEHVHNVVSSLSVDLLSAVRKVDAATNISKLFDESLKHHTPERLSTYVGLHGCHCNSSDSLVVPMECSCHSMDGCLSGKANDFPDSQFELDPKFVLRDSILVPVDSYRDASFHCKYESLCLCPLVQSIIIMKQPFE